LQSEDIYTSKALSIILVESVNVIIKICHAHTHGYRYTKGLTQNVNLRTNLKLEYNIKYLNYIQKN